MPIFAMTKYRGIATLSGANIKAKIVIAKTIPLPGKRCLDKAYAAMALNKITAINVDAVVSKLLNKYRLKGTTVDCDFISKSEKLSSVGLRTRNLGGYINNSLIGLNA